MENDINGYGYDTRAYGLGNLGSLSPLLGMGSSLAGYMGHNNVAKMLGQANGLMGTFSKHFPNGLGGGSFGGLGGPFNPGIQPGFGGQGYPFSGAQGQGFGMPFGPQSSGFGGFGGFGPSYPGFQGGGFGHPLQAMFGPHGYGGGMPGFF